MIVCVGRPIGVAMVVATLWIALTPGLPERSDADAVRLERLSASLPASGVRDTAPTGVGHGHDVPLSGDRKHLIVDATLNGTVTGPMLIDTGASYCVLTHGTARKLGLHGHLQRSIPVATANGQVEAPFVDLAAVELQEARLGDVRAVVLDAVEPPLIGIIGLNFLTEFRFSVDLANGRMRLEP